jgi:WD40-like Beta Propeller Repeat
MMNLKLVCISILLMSFSAQAQPTAPHLWGMDWPDTTPTRLVEDIPDTWRSFALSPDRTEILFHESTANGFRIRYSRFANGEWTDAVPAPFAADYDESYPAFSPDGNRVVFGSMRPRKPGAQGGTELNLWVVDREDGSWGEARLITNGVSTSTEHAPSLDKDGTLYFARRGVGLMNATMNDAGTWNRPKALPALVNEGGCDHPYVSPDGSLLFFGSGRSAPYPSHNLWVTERQPDGSWAAPRCLGDAFNAGGKSGWPHVSADGKILFWRQGRHVTFWVDMEAVKQ